MSKTLKIHDTLISNNGYIIPTRQFEDENINIIDELRGETGRNKRTIHSIPISGVFDLNVVNTDIGGFIGTNTFTQEFFELTRKNINIETDTEAETATLSIDMKFAAILELENMYDIYVGETHASIDYRLMYTYGGLESFNINDTTFDATKFRDTEGNVQTPMDNCTFRNIVYNLPSSAGVRIYTGESVFENNQEIVSEDILDLLSVDTVDAAFAKVFRIVNNKQLIFDPNLVNSNTGEINVRLRIIGIVDILQTGQYVAQSTSQIV